LQASSRTVTVGSSTVFAATVSGTAPLAYQWFKDGNALMDSTNVSGSVSNVLTLSVISTNDAGNYSLTVSNSYGVAASSNALLTVSTASGSPKIVVQPVGQSVGVSNSVSFSVTASGGLPLHYQWRKSGTKIFGATNSVFSIARVKTSDAAVYSVTITNGW